MTDLWDHLAERKVLDDRLRREIEEALGPRGRKALVAIDEGKIVQYRDFLVVEGRTARYIVEEEFCTCSDFLYRGRTCWHLLAARIARATGKYRVEESWYQDQLRQAAGQHNLD